MSPTDTTLYIYYVVGGVAFICNVFVVCRILSVGYRTTPSRLLLYLHLTLMVENACIAPNIYTANDGVCAFVGFIRTYFGLANLITVAMIVIHYRSLFTTDHLQIRESIIKHRERIIFLIPLISLLPFSTASYGDMDNLWCTIKDNDSTDVAWSIITFYSWLLLFICFNIFLMLYTVVEVLQADVSLASSLCRSIGVYVIVAVISYTFHCLARFHIFHFLQTNITIPISSLIYFGLFLLEMTALRRYEKETVTEHDHESVYLSWHVSTSVSHSTSRTASANFMNALRTLSPSNSSTSEKSVSTMRLQTLSKATENSSLSPHTFTGFDLEHYPTGGASLNSLASSPPSYHSAILHSQQQDTVRNVLLQSPSFSNHTITALPPSASSS